MRIRLRATVACLALLAAPSVSACAVTPVERSSPSPAIAMTRDEAVAIARASAPKFATAAVLEVILGRSGEDRFPTEKAPGRPGDHTFWLVNLGVVKGPLEASGMTVIIDAADGTVVSVVEWIS